MEKRRSYILTPEQQYRKKMDNLQVSAFQSLYRHRTTPDDDGKVMSNEEAFVTAIADTSDDMFECADPELIESWVRDYGNKKRRNSGLGEKK